MGTKPAMGGVVVSVRVAAWRVLRRLTTVAARVVLPGGVLEDCFCKHGSVWMLMQSCLKTQCPQPVKRHMPTMAHKIS